MAKRNYSQPKMIYAGLVQSNISLFQIEKAYVMWIASQRSAAVEPTVAVGREAAQASQLRFAPPSGRP
jgi:hypothetical protein